MLTRLRLRNFKRFHNLDIELGSPVVFVGPNNSGKTTALQALALWDVGLRRWQEKRRGRATPERRPGVTINRQDLLSIPVPDANLLWRELHVRDVVVSGGRQRTRNVRVDVIVDGVDGGQSWACGLEFDYANPESLYCRPLRTSDDDGAPRMVIPPEAAAVHVAYLPPMSGLAAVETRLDPGAIKVRLGEGRTAEVLRNLCHTVASGENGDERWASLANRIDGMFGIRLNKPRYIPERGEITMSYTEEGSELDISSGGRGLQQTLLLLAHMEVNPGSVLLLDEPDAHLEILRQRQTYAVLTEVATETGSQIIAASHSEVVLNEAGGKDVVIAFIGTPHRIDDRASQLRKSLTEIGFDQYAQAQQRGWVLYLEGSTDLAILRAFSEKLGHQASAALESPFVKYVGNQPKDAIRHFAGLREACPYLIGFGLFDRLDRGLPRDVPGGLEVRAWTRREIENYLSQRETLLAWAAASGEDVTGGPLFASTWGPAMANAIDKVEAALATLRPGADLHDAKASEEVLEPVFAEFFRGVGLPNLMNKSDFHTLARFVPTELVDPEVVEMLGLISSTAVSAKTR